MGGVNCLRCKYRHTDNGNCTAVGGFCTAVPAAHCPLLREYLDTELTPQEVLSMKFEWCAMMDALNSIGGGYTRLRELAEADKDGQLVGHVIQSVRRRNLRAQSQQHEIPRNTGTVGH